MTTVRSSQYRGHKVFSHQCTSEAAAGLMEQRPFGAALHNGLCEAYNAWRRPLSQIRRLRHASTIFARK